MARGGVYKTEVEKARNAVLAKGKHASVDAVRVALGNTGSKTTIHRYLKEIEAEDAQGLGGKFPISDVLADLVGRLAGQLTTEADQRIADAQARCDTQLRDRAAALDQARQENAALVVQVRSGENALAAERDAHHTTHAALAAAAVANSQLEERVAGLTTRLQEHEAHILSLEQKHAHAREALDHYRASVKEQRDQDQRRHEHQVQQLQVDVREARDGLTGKNQELLQLNRDNVRLTERSGQLDKDVRELRTQVRRHEGELQLLRPQVRELESLQMRHAQSQQASEALRADLLAAQAELIRERDGRQQAETIATQATSRGQAIEDLLARLKTVSVGETAIESSREGG